jgi:hypothetical protein
MGMRVRGATRASGRGFPPINNPRPRGHPSPAKQTYLRFIGEQRVVLGARCQGAFGDGRVLENVHVIKELQQIKRVARQLPQTRIEHRGVHPPKLLGVEILGDLSMQRGKYIFVLVSVYF